VTLAIDIGNSTVRIGLFSNGSLTVGGMDTHPLRPQAEYVQEITGLLSGVQAKGAVISSVVPGHTTALRAAVIETCGMEPLAVGAENAGGLVLDVDEPADVGPDRIAAAVAAVELCDAPVAVVDFGSATTVGFVGRGGVFGGGAILPGLSMMSRALSEGAARLPEVALRENAAPLGKNTEDNIVSGIIYGTAGAVRKIIDEAGRTEAEDYKIAVTGGCMRYVLPYLGRVDLVEPNLVLKGLKFIFDRRG
jgi:type III pantothenate kinase